MDGESVIFSLISKFITLQHDMMLDIEDEMDFQVYFTKKMPKDCLDRVAMQDLLE